MHMSLAPGLIAPMAEVRVYILVGRIILKND